MDIYEKARITGEDLGRYKQSEPAQLNELLKQSKEAFESWRRRSIKERTAFLGKFREYLVLNSEKIAEYISKSTGKPLVEALTSDVLSTLEFIQYYEKNTEKILRFQKRKTPLILFNNSSFVEYSPIGSVFVICPWNYPLQLSLVPAITAFAAGNTVIIKPSEITPGIGNIIEEMCRFAGLPEGIILVAQGGKETVETVIDGSPDKVFFTGSAFTGQKIMELCAKRLIPLDLELGGKDPMIVFADAEMSRACEGAIYGSFANSGQMCVASKRIYVEAPVYDRFAEMLGKRAESIKVGTGLEADVGAVTLDKSIELIERHYEDAVKKGAKPLNKYRKEQNYVYPLVIKDVTPEMLLAKDETFGPIVPVMRFDTEEQAIALANDSNFGLNASVWTKDSAKARRVASAIEAGNVYINDVSKNIGNPNLPFGGVKKSGIGRYHGPEGLYAFSNIKSVMINKNKGKELNWFPYSAGLFEDIKVLIDTLYGKIPIFRRIKNYIRLAGRLKRK